MWERIKDIFRKKALRKYGSRTPTCILPLSEIKSAVAFINVEDPSFDDCKEAVLAFFKENGIRIRIFFFDFRKIDSEELLITSIETTILKKDLNWLGRPDREKVEVMQQGRPDLFLSLVPGGDFPIEFMAKCSEARFKAGRRQLPGKTFDLVVSDTGDRTMSQKEAFEEMRKYILKIK